MSQKKIELIKQDLQESQKKINQASSEILNIIKFISLKGGGIATKEREAICIHKENINNHLIAMYYYILHTEDKIFSKFEAKFNVYYSSLCKKPHLSLKPSNINELKQKARILYK